MPNEPLVSIVIPVYGHQELVEECTSALPSTTSVPYSLTLIDDATPDPGMQKYLGTKIKEAKIMRNFQNMGFGQTVNKAAKAGFSKYLCILNSDAQPMPGWLDVMVDDLERHPKHAIVGPLLLFHPESRMGPGGSVQHAGMTFDIRRKPFHRFIGWNPSHKRVREYRDDLQAVTGACMLVRRSVWNEIGGFHKVYGKGTFEDAELCIQTKHKGYSVVYTPDAMLYHRVGASAADTGGFPVSMNYQIFCQRVGGIVEYDQWKLL